MTKQETKSVFFTTPHAIDPVSWSVMGVNAKPDNDNPIGFFGTGLKYALAVLLRHGQKVSIASNQVLHQFYTESGDFRGKDFDFCFCKTLLPSGEIHKERLPFTTELGKNWEIWMAYRELFSNTMDEGGEVDDQPKSNNTATIIKVDGDEFHKAFSNHDDYFSDGRDVLYKDTGWGKIEILSKGKGQLFYKGILVGQAEEKTPFDYNCTNPYIKLTEDRTLKDLYDYTYYIRECFASTIDEKMAEYFVTNRKWESTLVELGAKPSETVMKVVSEIWKKTPSKLNNQGMTYVNKYLKSKEFVPVELKPTQELMLKEALDFLKKAGVETEAPIQSIENKEDNLIAFVYDKTIHLTQSAFESGKFDLAATLFEEICHINGYVDNCRKFEQYLMKKIINLMQETTGVLL